MRLFFVYGLTSEKLYKLMEFLDNRETGFVRNGAAEWRLLIVEDIHVVLNQEKHTWDVCLVQPNGIPEGGAKEAASRVTYLLEEILRGYLHEIYDGDKAAARLLWNKPGNWRPRSSAAKAVKLEHHMPVTAAERHFQALDRPVSVVPPSLTPPDKVAPPDPDDEIELAKRAW